MSERRSQRAEIRGQGSEVRSQNKELLIPHPQRRKAKGLRLKGRKGLFNPLPSVLYPLALILYPFSFLLFPFSFFLFPFSFIPHPSSFTLCLFLLLSGCSLNRLAVRQTAGIIDGGLPAVFAQSDPQYVKEALPGNLQLMEILLQNDPSNRKLLINAAQGFCGYALMFIEDENPERASFFYAKGEAYASRALKGVKLETAKKADVPPLFWQTFCKASYININRDKPEAVAELPGIEPAAERILTLDPGYYYNGAQSILGAYYSIRPRILGGDSEKARVCFELALKGEGGSFLLNRLMYAKLAAVAAQDAGLFENLLNTVLTAEPKDGPTRLPDEVAKIKAKKLLEKKDELF